ncbi:hypothetical protein [Pseudomonas fluvialis]|uniref:hypothetical protein n=1 Tax=Pseudomonas fluvialis TaxID=1793966 RepID=UPI0035B1790A
MLAQLDGLEVADNQRKKQSRFDITNTPLTHAGQRQPLPSIADVSQPVQQVPGNADRARRMQAQFDQPVTRGTPPSIVAGAGGQVAGSSAGSPLMAPAGSLPPKDNAPAPRSSPLTTPTQPVKNNAQGYAFTGIGADRAGGEIVARRGASGVMEFTNENATPGSVASASPMARETRGTFSQMQPGDSQLALDRFERANQERQRMNEISRRGQIGEGGGRLSIIEDNSWLASRRAPTLAERQRARLNSMGAEADAVRSQTQQGILSGMDERLTNQLSRQRTQQELAAGQVGLENQQRLAKLGVMLANPELGQRADVEREYLLRADPKAYLDQQAKAGIGQVELETKQIKRDLLRSELEQGGAGGNLKLTEQQSKDLGYYTRGNEANAQLARQGDALTSRATGERGQIRGISDTVIRGTPLIGDSALANSLVSTERQQAEQAGREVLAAILRKDTGAAITNQEMEIYGKMYLPQAGDSEEVLNQKAEARTRALASIRGGLGTAERKAAPLLNGQRTSDEAPTRISGDAEYYALPSGALFIAPDGTTRRKP